MTQKSEKLSPRVLARTGLAAVVIFAGVELAGLAGRSSAEAAGPTPTRPPIGDNGNNRDSYRNDHGRTHSRPTAQPSPTPRSEQRDDGINDGRDGDGRNNRSDNNRPDRDRDHGRRPVHGPAIITLPGTNSHRSIVCDLGPDGRTNGTVVITEVQNGRVLSVRRERDRACEPFTLVLPGQREVVTVDRPVPGPERVVVVPGAAQPGGPGPSVRIGDIRTGDVNVNTGPVTQSVEARAEFPQAPEVAEPAANAPVVPERPRQPGVPKTGQGGGEAPIAPLAGVAALLIAAGTASVYRLKNI